MPAQIRPNRLEVTDRFPMLAFSLASSDGPRLAEVVIASDISLFTNQAARNSGNFYSSREHGSLAIPGSGSIYTVPPLVLARFIAANRLYFGLATASPPAGQDWRIDVMPGEASPYVSLSGLTDRALRRVRMFPVAPRTNAAAPSGGTQWVGDTLAAPAPIAAAPTAPVEAAAPAAVPYNDGFGPLEPLAPVAPASPALQPDAVPTNGPAEAPVAAQGLGNEGIDPETRGIECGSTPWLPGDPEPTTAVVAGLALSAAEYPRTARTAPSPAFNAGRGGQAIERIVIHITDGPSTASAVNTFTAAGAQASSHYLVGQDGEVVQFVSEADTAWHARGGNRNSVGIEHVAIKVGGADYQRPNGTTQHFDALAPTAIQYSESAALVTYLCDKYGIAPSRTTIVGHNEVATNHPQCPTGNWDWDHFMHLVTNRVSAPLPTGQGLGLAEALDVANASTAPTGTRLVFQDIPGSWKTDDYRDVALTSIAWDNAPETVIAFAYFGHPALDDDGSPTAYHPNDIGDDRLSSGRDENGWFGVVSYSEAKAPTGAVLDLRPEMRGGDGKYPVIQQASNGDPSPGYYVSATSAVIEGYGNHQQSRYYNAKTVPFGALAGRLKRQGVDLGDYGLAIRHNQIKCSPFRMLDAGGSGKWSLGEVSRRVITNLGGNPSRNGNRVNYGNDYPTSFLIFPGFEKDFSGPFTETDISPTIQTILSRLSAATNARDLALLLALNEVPPGQATPGKAALDRFFASPNSSLPAHYANVVASLRANGFSFADPAATGQGLEAGGDEETGENDGSQNLFAQGLRASNLLTDAEYPGAVVMPATAWGSRGDTAIDRIVIHITSSPQSPTRGRPFTEPGAKTSAHYMVDQLGVVKQFVREQDMAIHAHDASPRSIGIEHVAIQRGGQRYERRGGGYQTFPYSPPTQIQLETSAALVAHLCRKYGMPPDRTTIVGHAEIDPKTTHTDCPLGAWDWDVYMPLVTAAYAVQTVVGAVGSVVESVGGAIGLGTDDWSINWDGVYPVGQPTNVSCWATSAAMIEGWRLNQSISVESIANFDKFTVQNGLPNASHAEFGRSVGFTVHPNACFTADGFREVIEANGPVWVVAKVPGQHAIVVTGMYKQDGQYYVRITDPWDRIVGSPGSPGNYAATHNTGSQYIMTYDAFAAEFEAASGEPDYAQLLHTGGAHGHTINRGSAAAAGYAQGLARQLGDEVAKPAIVPPSLPKPAPTPVEAAQTRQTSSADGRSYDLAQRAGMVRPANSLAGGAGMPPIPGPRVLLNEWPYIEEGSDRTAAPVAIDWKFDGAAVGDVSIVPDGGAVFNGRTIQVRADIETCPGNPNRAELLVRVTTTFTKAGEPDEVAVSEVTLGGDGMPSTRHAGAQPAAAPAPVAAPAAPEPHPVLV